MGKLCSADDPLRALIEKMRQEAEENRKRGDNSGESDPPWAYQHAANGAARALTKYADALEAALAASAPPLSPDSDGYANCRSCHTATWCDRFKLCLSETHADDYAVEIKASPASAPPRSPDSIVDHGFGSHPQGMRCSICLASSGLRSSAILHFGKTEEP